jgi:asparaginyl-tRNA synthetase
MLAGAQDSGAPLRNDSHRQFAARETTMIDKGDYIRDILARPDGAAVSAHGWVKTRRDSKGVHFVQMNDGSGFHDLQVVIEAGQIPEETLSRVTTGACVRVTGELVASPGAGQAVELKAREIYVYGPADPAAYPLQKKGHTMEFLREIAHLRPRSNTFGAVFRVRNALSVAIHQFFQDRGFFYVQTPIITGSDAEGAGEMFGVTTLDLLNLPRTGAGSINFEEDFFGKPAHLTVSGQLEAEIFALAFTNVYTFGPTFRAENSNTPRHLAEFWMVEPEMAFCDLDGNRRLAEEFLKSIIIAVLDQCQPDLQFFNQRIDNTVLSTLEHVAGSEFAHISYTEAICILEKARDEGHQWEFPVHWGVNLQSEHERHLTEEAFKRPVIVTDYPKEIKAFYMRRNEDGKTVRAMDVLVPRIGEIIGGSQREERHDVLLQTIREQGLPEENYWWYLELRKYGTAPHAGFGLGLERMMMYLTGMKNIRDVIPFPRTPGYVEF